MQRGRIELRSAMLCFDRGKRGWIKMVFVLILFGCADSTSEISIPEIERRLYRLSEENPNSMFWLYLDVVKSNDSDLRALGFLPVFVNPFYHEGRSDLDNGVGTAEITFWILIADSKRPAAKSWELIIADKTFEANEILAENEINDNIIQFVDAKFTVPLEALRDGGGALSLRRGAQKASYCYIDISNDVSRFIELCKSSKNTDNAPVELYIPLKNKTIKALKNREAVQRGARNMENRK